MSMESQKPVVVVGGGLAGLSCARAAAARGKRVVVLEAGDAVGGRVRTDRVRTGRGAFLIDRGFQVLLTAYPEAQRALDYAGLDLRAFYPGALVRYAGAFHRVAHPWKRPVDAAKSFLTPVATLADQPRIARMYAANRLHSLDGLWSRAETTTAARLRDEGLSRETVDRFFRAFFGGVFFDRELETSSRMFDFVFRMFAGGDTVLPALGMQRIPEQLAAGLPAGSVRLGASVALLVRREGRVVGVVLESGETIDASSVVLATEGDTAERLAGLGGTAKASFPGWVSTATLSFDTAGPTPTDEPILYLDGDGRGPVNHLAFPSTVSSAYAPSGTGLAAANVVGEHAERADADLERAARAQVREWFGEGVDRWTLIRIDRIRRALPDFRVRDGRGAIDPPDRTAEWEPGLWVCGDHRTNASIDGAMASGRRCGELVV